jgi:hypothetical protein
VLSNGHDVGSRYFENWDTAFDSGIKVDMVRANTSRDANFELLGLFEEFGGQVTVLNSMTRSTLSNSINSPRVERSGDEDISLRNYISTTFTRMKDGDTDIWELLLENTVGAFFAT